MLQHRGQDSAGMVTLKDGKFIEYKANGLVKDVFNNTKTMDKLQGKSVLFDDSQIQTCCSTMHMKQADLASQGATICISGSLSMLKLSTCCNLFLHQHLLDCMELLALLANMHLSRSRLLLIFACNSQVTACCTQAAVKLLLQRLCSTWLTQQLGLSRQCGLGARAVPHSRHSVSSGSPAFLCEQPLGHVPCSQRQHHKYS